MARNAGVCFRGNRSRPTPFPSPLPPVKESASTTTAAPASPHLQLAWSGLTDRGRIRSDNEDTFVAFTFDGRNLRYLGKTGEAPLTTGDFVFAVSDGMGGAQRGEFASRTAVDKVAHLLPRSFKLSAEGINSGFHDILVEAVDAAHRELTRLGQAYEECAGMGATLSLAWFTPAWMYFAHVGDSRIYHLSAGGRLVQVTHDHSQAGWLRRKGQINEREARTHPTRHSLQQTLGGGTQFLDPHIGAVGYRAGDRFLLCSDGLTDGLWDHHIDEMLRASDDLAIIVAAMVKRSLANSGRDNTTAIVVEVRQAPSV